MEYDDGSFVNCSGLSVERDKLSYCGQDCTRIPPALGNMYGDKVHYLDLSYNHIETLRGLEKFTQLEELVLDNNQLNDTIVLPRMEHLKTLSLNNNQISSLEPLLEMISARCPSLTYLSLLSNKACPDCFSDTQYDDNDYQRYRHYVLYKLPKLRFLDSRRVSHSERAQAALRGQYSRVHRPADIGGRGCAAGERGHEAGGRLPVDVGALGKHKGAYSKCSYTYTGTHSEGNRYIVNSDL